MIIFRTLIILWFLAFALPVRADSVIAPPVTTIARTLENLPCCSIIVDMPGFREPCVGEAVSCWIDEQKQKFISRVSPEKDESDTTPELEIIFGEAVSRGHCLSLKYNVCEYWGGAHPNCGIETFVFDLKTGKRLVLADIFTDPPKGLNVLSAESLKQLEKKRDRELAGEERAGLLPTMGNFRYFALGKTGITLFFPVYRTGARGLGEQRTDIPYEKLKTWLKPDLIPERD